VLGIAMFARWDILERRKPGVLITLPLLISQVSLNLKAIVKRAYP